MDYTTPTTKCVNLKHTEHKRTKMTEQFEVNRKFSYFTKM